MRDGYGKGGFSAALRIVLQSLFRKGKKGFICTEQTKQRKKRCRAAQKTNQNFFIETKIKIVQKCINQFQNWPDGVCRIYLCCNFGGFRNADCGGLLNLRCNNQVIKLADCFKLDFWDDLIEGLNEYQYISNPFHYNDAES